MGLKRIVAKNPKSLAFAWLADLLRVASSGDKQKLDEALLTANKGLDIYPNFLPGRLARGRILLEQGDLTGAKSDFEAVAKQDLFCSVAQKLLLETAEKLGQPPETEIYEKILGTLEPGAAVKVNKTVAKSKTESVGVNAALDDILSEEDNTDDKEDSAVSDLLLKTFDNIFESGKQEQPMPDLVPYSPPARKSSPPPPPSPPPPSVPSAPDVDALINEQLKSKVENVPDLTGDMSSLLESASALPPVSGAISSPSPPDVDALINEQLKSKVENIPDLTGDIDSLLASAPASPPDIDALVNEQLKSKVENVLDLTGDMSSLLESASALPPVSGAISPTSPPDLDALVNEQLKSKVENVPDLTGDMSSLLESAPASPPDIDALINEQLKSKVENVPDLTGDISSLLASAPELPPVPDTPSSPSSPDLDALIKEQLSSKVENVPDLTGDMSSLLASAPELSPVSDTPSPPSPPDLDSLIKEQLSSKVENVPDFTGDLDSLLASAPTLEPSLSDSYSSPPASGTPSSPSPPDLDSLIKEQLSSKVENVPDFTGDLDSLLSSAPALEPSLSDSYSLHHTSDVPSSPNSPDLDSLIKEQLSSKVENIPDFTGDIDSLLASAPASDSNGEPELVPYVPPASKSDSMLTQTPTPTLAELYMDQGLPKKAVEVYKELLIQDPNNADLKTKLALAEMQM